MAHYIINPLDFVHIPEHSYYNNNYYRNIHTGDVIFEEYEDDGCGHYYNLGQNPTFTNNDWRTGIDMGCGEYGEGFDCGNQIFETDTEWC